jgi:anti-sigma factor RsiW
MRIPAWSTLSAYVDGELDADAAAAVADAAGNDDGGTAEKIALLYQLKGVSHATAPTAPRDLVDLLPKRRPRWPATFAAAAMALLMIGSALWVSLSAMHAPTLPSDVLATARMLHSQWLSYDEAKASSAEPVVLLAALSQFGQAPVVPDLESLPSAWSPSPTARTGTSFRSAIAAITAAT